MTSGREIADALFRRKAFIFISSALLLASVTAAWRMSGSRVICSPPAGTRDPG